MERLSSGVYATVEFGGTTTRLALVNKAYDAGKLVSVKIVEKKVVLTTTPEEVFTHIQEFFAGKEFIAIGIASFGPIALSKADKHFGFITTTPKPGFQYTDVVGEIKRRLGRPDLLLGFDTDVNACAMGEYLLGGHVGVKSIAYITVGTGVGVGIMANGLPIHGLTHPEGGHIFVKVHPTDLDFPGVCPFHGTCLEGLVTNNAIAKRRNCTVHELEALPDEDPLWPILGYYLGQLCLNLLLFLSVEKIVIGGGILQRKAVFHALKAEFPKLLAGYVRHPQLDNIDTYIVPPVFGVDEGIVGAAAVLDFDLER
eukprot:TRINITY_DN3548_c0_g4_i1.p1 TRINITY_DN3548_c0_g4~~TRINITY_DN3548_c0_g4_i1.p1  ORF type:complete len:312 (-),score=70.66 TRINITY_DN3548_c0_g4_i1:156-1091(-)